MDKIIFDGKWTHEFEWKQLGGGARDVVHRTVAAQVVEAFRLTILTQVGGAGAGDLLQAGQPFTDQRRVPKGAGAQRAIDAFGDQVDKAVGLADGQLDIRVARQELR